MPNSQSEAPQIDAAKTIMHDTEKRLNIGPEHRDLADVIAVLSEVHSQGLPRHPVLAIFYTGLNAPPDCLPMKRWPEPPVGFVLSRDFPRLFTQALAINEAVHDGAIAFGRMSSTEPYRCTGWSYLICPKEIADPVDGNRGAAYNSAIFLSANRAIDCVALFSAKELEVFVSGKRAANLAKGQHL